MKHIDDTALERYYLGMVTEPELGGIEEHLLWCQACLDRAEASNRYVSAMRTAAIRGSYDLEVES
jgi:hypothetical protein